MGFLCTLVALRLRRGLPALLKDYELIPIVNILRNHLDQNRSVSTLKIQPVPLRYPE
jgi:hypothetical protein